MRDTTKILIITNTRAVVDYICKIGFDVFQSCFPQKHPSPQGVVSPVHCVLANGGRFGGSMGCPAAWSV